MENDVIADIKKEYLNELAGKGKRVSGREINESRDIAIEIGIIETAEGSARVRLGRTDVLVGIKAGVGEPFPDIPNKGVIITNCELIPMASPNFDGGRPREDAIELARVVDRGIRESEAIDLESLCMVEGEKVWVLFIDIHVLDYSGNLFDAAGIGALCALKNTVIPASGENEGGEDFQLELKHRPVPATFAKIDGHLFLDPDLDEEKICRGRLIICTDENGDIRAMQKSKGGCFTSEEIGGAIEMAVERGKEVRRFLETA